MHVLRIVVGIVEVDDALLVGTHDLLGKEHAHGKVLGDLAGHVVALDRVDSRVLVGVLLLDVLVVALDERQDLVVGGVLLALEALHVAIDDVTTRDVIAVQSHDLVLDHVLDLLDRDGVARSLATVTDVLGGVDDLTLRQPLIDRRLGVGTRDGIRNLLDIEGNLGTVALDDLHVSHPFFGVRTRYDFAY